METAGGSQSPGIKSSPLHASSAQPSASELKDTRVNLVYQPGPTQTWLLSTLRSWTLGSRFSSSKGSNSQTQIPSPLSLWDLEYSSYILVIPYATLNLLLCLPTYY